jgi:hypothetical protein
VFGLCCVQKLVGGEAFWGAGPLVPCLVVFLLFRIRFLRVCTKLVLIVLLHCINFTNKMGFVRGQVCNPSYAGGVDGRIAL